MIESSDIWPADARQWKEFDDKYYLEFGNDSRNVRFALSMDGMNPFGESTSTHITWLVILTMYNLHTWLCQKRKISSVVHPYISVRVY